VEKKKKEEEEEEGMPDKQKPHRYIKEVKAWWKETSLEQEESCMSSRNGG